MEEAAWEFSQNLTKIMGREHKENFLVSPLSAFIALSAVMTGAKGDNKKELAKLLIGTNSSDSKALCAWIKLKCKEIQSSKKLTLNIANKICINKADQSFKLLPTAVKKLEEYFLAQIEAIDFGNKIAVNVAINKWASEKTNGKITKLVDELGDDANMIVMNAVYFKGGWEKAFFNCQIKTRRFTSFGKILEVPFMCERGYYPYHDFPELDARVLKISYRDRHYSMLFILPNKRDALDDVEKKMQTVKLSEIIERLWGNALVKLYIPKFKVEADYDLKEALMEMGCTTMFSKIHSDFTGFCKQLPYPLYISVVKQKTFIEVNEQGTEAAAVTYLEQPMLGCAPGSYREPIPEVFDANHPFLFYLIYSKDENNSVLFNGRICEPKND